MNTPLTAASFAAIDASLMLVEIDFDSTIRSVNDCFLAHFESRREGCWASPIGISARASGPTRSGGDGVLARLAAGEAVMRTFEHVGPQARTTWMALSMLPVKDALGHASHVLILARDCDRAKTRSVENQCKLDAISRSRHHRVRSVGQHPWMPTRPSAASRPARPRVSDRACHRRDRQPIICWPSMPRPGGARRPARAWASRWWPAGCANSPGAARCPRADRQTDRVGDARSAWARVSKGGAQLRGAS